MVVVVVVEGVAYVFYVTRKMENREMEKNQHAVLECTYLFHSGCEGGGICFPPGAWLYEKTEELSGIWILEKTKLFFIQNIYYRT